MAYNCRRPHQVSFHSAIFLYEATGTVNKAGYEDEDAEKLKRPVKSCD